jgi:V8-like Glu-specific endopeptidase
MNTHSTFLTSSRIASVVLACAASAGAFAGPQVSKAGAVTVLTPAAAAVKSIDYANAISLDVPRALFQSGSQLDSLLEAQAAAGVSSASGVAGGSGTPAGAGNAAGTGFSAGGAGSGQLSPVTLVAPKPSAGALASQGFIVSEAGGVAPQDYGTSSHVYTEARTNALGDLTTRYYPYRATGKLWFNIGSGTYVCSASLIKPGVIVTAAHCVANFGASQFYSNWQFAAAYDGGVAPYGIATAKQARVMTVYYNGTDSCAQRGVVCQNDVAVIVLNSNVGSSAGWYGYGWNGYSYANNQAHITQLGYPQSIDGGSWQERTDSQGYVSGSMSNNTVIGSAMTGGSSGGPWLVNLGIAGSNQGAGLAPNGNIVVGVTSWGYTSPSIKEQGASPFTSNNIVPLVNAACSAYPGSC